jgi:hypothetical protein
MSNAIPGDQRLLTLFALAVLIFYSPKRVQEAFWSQILTIYSLLLTCLVSVIRGDLTRFHALVVLALVLSPITVYFVAYAIRSFWSTQHRLESLLGRTRYLRRFIVLLAGSAWLAIFIYTYLPKAVDRFAQASCKGRSVMEFFYLIVPFIYIGVYASEGVVYPLVLFLIPVISHDRCLDYRDLPQKKGDLATGRTVPPPFCQSLVSHFCLRGRTSMLIRGV